jgi:putative FmdB family regulatory protein
MPRYDYRCNDCGIVYEKREGFDAPALQTCPECSGSARRLLTPPAIVFKGSGWYATDSRKGSSDSESSPSSASGPKSDTSTPSKDTSGSSSSKDASGSSSGKDSATSSKSEGTAKT